MTLIFASTLGLGLLIFLGNTRPNVEVVVLNQSGQPLSSIQLQTEKSGKNIFLRGIDVGAEVLVKFHNDGGDTFFLLIRFPDGKEIRGENVYFGPGYRVVETISQSEDGFERTYQGSCLLAHRKLRLAPGQSEEHTFTLKIS